MKVEQPERAEVGQIWRDNDERSSGAGEFTIVELGKTPGKGQWVKVRRHATGRHSVIQLARLLKSSHKVTGYTYLGKER